MGLRKGHADWREDIYVRICFKIFTCHHQLEGEERPPTWLVVVVLVSRLDGARQERRRGRRLGVKSLAAGAQASLSAIGNSILQVSEPQLRGSASGGASLQACSGLSHLALPNTYCPKNDNSA